MTYLRAAVFVLLGTGWACAGSTGESGGAGKKNAGADPAAKTKPESSEPGGARATSGSTSFCDGLEADGEGAPGEEARVTRDAALAAKEVEAGLAHAAKGDHGAALGAFERAIAADPVNGIAYLEAAESHLFTDNDTQKMKRLLARALDLLPSNPRAHLRFGEVAHELGMEDRAVAHWKCALEVRPDLVEARKHLGMHWLAKGKLEEAEQELTRAAADAPDDLQMHVVLANLLEAKKKPLEAAKEVEAAAKIAEKSAALYRRAAQLYEDAGSFVAAKKMRAMADHLDPPPKERKLRPLPKARK